VWCGEDPISNCPETLTFLQIQSRANPPAHELLLALQAKTESLSSEQASAASLFACMHCKRTFVDIKAAMRGTTLGCCVLWAVWLSERVSATKCDIA
jgi:protein-arginine kinase activator protein McsA